MRGNQVRWDIDIAEAHNNHLNIRIDSLIPICFTLLYTSLHIIFFIPIDVIDYYVLQCLTSTYEIECMPQATIVQISAEISHYNEPIGFDRSITWN